MEVFSCPEHSFQECTSLQLPGRWLGQREEQSFLLDFFCIFCWLLQVSLCTPDCEALYFSSDYHKCWLYCHSAASELLEPSLLAHCSVNCHSTYVPLGEQGLHVSSKIFSQEHKHLLLKLANLTLSTLLLLYLITTF